MQSAKTLTKALHDSGVHSPFHRIIFSAEAWVFFPYEPAKSSSSCGGRTGPLLLCMDPAFLSPFCQWTVSFYSRTRNLQLRTKAALIFPYSLCRPVSIYFLPLEASRAVFASRLPSRGSGCSPLALCLGQPSLMFIYLFIYLGIEIQTVFMYMIYS